MMIDFPDKETGQLWCNLESSIKDDAQALWSQVAAGGHRYDGMTAEHKAYGERWLNKVNQLRNLGHGVPPSIERSFKNYQAIKRGDEPPPNVDRH